MVEDVWSQCDQRATASLVLLLELTAIRDIVCDPASARDRYHDGQLFVFDWRHIRQAYEESKDWHEGK